jgi:hypothetical protein
MRTLRLYVSTAVFFAIAALVTAAYAWVTGSSVDHLFPVTVAGMAIVRLLSLEVDVAEMQKKENP